MAPAPDPVRSIEVVDAEELADQASALLLARMEDALAARGRVRVILAGGATPRRTYESLAEGISRLELPRDRLEWFFGDERWVPVDDPQSNEGMARAALLGPCGAPEETIHSWRAGAGDPVECARAYGDTLQEPDLLVLGLGADGHTASLFPGATAYLPGGRTLPVGPAMPSVAAAVRRRGDSAREWRLTLCPDFLRTSRCVVFLVAGPDKAEALTRARNGDPATPAAWIRGAETLFIVTRDTVAGVIRLA